MTSKGHWKYHIVKKMRQRAEHRRDSAKTHEGFQAWDEVVKWLSDIANNGRHLNRYGAIAIPGDMPGDEEEIVRIENRLAGHIQRQHGAFAGVDRTCPDCIRSYSRLQELGRAPP